MATRPQTHYWQFYVTEDRDLSADDAVACFEAQARQLADTLGCRLVRASSVTLEQTGARKWVVSGTVTLIRGTT